MQSWIPDQILFSGGLWPPFLLPKNDCSLIPPFVTVFLNIDKQCFC